MRDVYTRDASKNTTGNTEITHRVDRTKAPVTEKTHATPRTDKDRGLHPTQKPVPLLEYLIRTYTNAGDTVLDNCMGSASTGAACANTGRQFIGIEKERRFFDIACHRLESLLSEPKQNHFDLAA
jgi:DNA modification methylase